MNPELSIVSLKKYFPVIKTSRGIFRKTVGEIKAVDDITLNINKGETFGLVGESGSGKTTLGRTILRLIEPDSGDIFFKEKNITTMEEEELRRLRRDITIVFQDPYSSLNLKRRIKDIIADPLIIHNICGKDERFDRVNELLALVKLPEEYAYRRPYALSGGEKQRVAIARALSVNPQFIVLDEPTSSVDVSVQAKIINLLRKLQQDLHLTYLFITHDLILIKNVADFIGVMYAGKMLELARSEDLFTTPMHPYTNNLLSAIPLISKDKSFKAKYKSASILIDTLNMVDLPKGCRFYSRCATKKDVCQNKIPELRKIEKDHFVACHLS